MRTNLFAATCVAMLLAAFTCTPSRAQPKPAGPAGPAQPPGNPGQGQGNSGQSQGNAAHPPGSAAQLNLSHGIAVIDIGFIVDRYSRVKQEQEAWKRDMESVGAGLKKEDEAIAKSAERLKALKPGAPDFKTLEEELTQKSSDLKVKLQLQEKEFNDRRARILLKAYQEITAQVKAFAERNGVSLVLQFDGSPVDQNNPRSVQNEVMKLVVYQNGIDISTIILDELNRRAATTGIAQPPRGGPQQSIRK